MSVQVIVGNVSTVIQGDLPEEAERALRKTMSYVVPGHQFMPRFKKDQLVAAFEGREPWDGTKTVARWMPEGLTFPTGLYSYCREVLEANGVRFSTKDHRPPVYRSPGWSAPSLQMRDYQADIVKEGLNRQRGVMKACTGSGKTEMIIDMFIKASVFPAIFYVTSSDLLEQAYDRFREYVLFNGAKAEIGRAGAGFFDLQPITIMTVQLAQRALEGHYTKNKFDDVQFDDKTELKGAQKSDLVDFIRQAQFTYVDEAQHVASDTIQSILGASHKARFRIGGSASPWRDDGLDILIEAAFGRRFCDIPASFLIRANWLVKPYITFNHFNQVLGPTASWAAHYSEYVVNNVRRNRWIAKRAVLHMGHRRPTIILVKHVSHAKILAEMVGEEGGHCEILTSSGDCKKSSTKRKEVLNRMRQRELWGIIATSLLDEGVDVPAASALICAGGGKSSTRELQRIGRVIRRDKNDKNKTCAWVEEFFDHTRWLMHHAKDRRRILETEPEFEINDFRDIERDVPAPKKEAAVDHFGFE